VKNQQRLSRRMLLGGSIGVAGLLALSANPQSAHASSAILHKSDMASIDAMSSNSINTGKVGNTSHASKATTPLAPSKTTPPPTPTLPKATPLPKVPAPTPSLPFMIGDVDPKVNGFDPMEMLTDFDRGTVSKLPTGQTLREFTITATNKTILVAPGQKFDAWAFNGRVPGPAIRATAGDHVRIRFINKSTAAHGIHFHGIHSGNVDGAFLSVVPGRETVYEFDAQPVGVHLYHCHMSPLFTHIYKGLYGFFIIDPPQPRPQALELAMMMNGFSFKLNPGSDDSNDLHAINTVAYHFFKHPIPIPINKLVRVYLGGMLEFDKLFGFQMHSNMFNLFPTGTSLEPTELTDSVLMCQGQRAILEFSFKFPGSYMFRSLYSEHADKGFMGTFQVK